MELLLVLIFIGPRLNRVEFTTQFSGKTLFPVASATGNFNLSKVTMQSLDQKNTQRHMPCRNTIMQVLQKSNIPLSVSEIHARALEIKSGIGIATVYRALKSFRDNGEIRVVLLLSGETCYERTLQGHRDHFECRKCHRIYDLDVFPLRIKAGTRLPGGYLIEDHQTLLSGICPCCTK